MGGNFNLWHKQTEIYLRNFPEEKHADIILNLLDGEAFVLAMQSSIFHSAVSANTFNRLRRLLDSPKLPLEYRREFKNRRQLPGESARAYASSLEELALRAFDPEDEKYIERRILEQFIEGVSLASVQRKFILHPPATLDAAISKAELL